MTILIFEADQHTIQQVTKGGSSFSVRSKLVLHAEQGRIGYTIVDVPAYTKQYGMEEFDPQSYLDQPDKVIFLPTSMKSSPGRSGCKSGGMAMPISTISPSRKNIAGRAWDTD